MAWPIKRKPNVYEPRQIQPYETEIASRPGWVLVRSLDRGPVENPSWRTFKLYRTVTDRKVVYLFAFGLWEDRMAKVHDWAVLETHAPEVARWVLDEVREWAIFNG